jgi:hypothetical protein
MQNVYCSGTTALLNLCASGIVPKCIPIICLKNLYYKEPELSKMEFKDINLKERYNQDIAFFFGYQIIYKEPFNLKIKENDIITSNLLRFLLPFLKGQQLTIFPEGASCFTPFAKNAFSNKIYFMTTSLIKRFMIGYYKSKTKWILPDKDGRVRSFIKNIDGYKLISEKVFFSNLKRCSSYIRKKYPELAFDENIIFHPAIPYIDKSLYKKWFENFKEIIGKKKLLVKPHENDYRDYRKVFEKFDCTIVSKKFITMPAELITENCKADYLGYYSTIMLMFKKNNTNFIVPPDPNTIKISNHEYRGLKTVLNI